MTKTIKPRTVWQRDATQNDLIGRRVQIPAWADLWMQGARFGTIEAVRRVNDGSVWQALVRMDHPQVTKRPAFLVEDLTAA